MTDSLAGRGLDLTAIQKRLDAATPGPWTWGTDWSTLDYQGPDGGGDKYAESTGIARGGAGRERRVSREQSCQRLARAVCEWQLSFFIAPDGSKEGWDTSDNAEAGRAAFLDWLATEARCYATALVARFGGDDPDVSVRLVEASRGASPEQEHAP